MKERRARILSAVGGVALTAASFTSSCSADNTTLQRTTPVPERRVATPDVNRAFTPQERRFYQGQAGVIQAILSQSLQPEVYSDIDPRNVHDPQPNFFDRAGSSGDSVLKSTFRDRIKQEGQGYLYQTDIRIDKNLSPILQKVAPNNLMNVTLLTNFDNISSESPELKQFNVFVQFPDNKVQLSDQESQDLARSLFQIPEGTWRTAKVIDVRTNASRDVQDLSLRFEDGEILVINSEPRGAVLYHRKRP